jgi:isoleucyl-tRNA synthetase
VSAENLSFSETDLGSVTKNTFRMLWNSYSFFTTYATIDSWSPTPEASEDYKLSTNILDVWIVSELQLLIQHMTEELEGYRPAQAARLIAPFVDDLSNWYIRRSRKRFWKNENDDDKNDAYQTLYTVLVEVSKLMAPFTPFIAEEIYRNLTDEESVHLAEWPQSNKELVSEKSIENMAVLRELVTIGLQHRSDEGIKVRQPLQSIILNEVYEDFVVTELLVQGNDYAQILLEELNVKEVKLALEPQKEKVVLDFNLTPELKLEGESREIIRAIQEGRKQAQFNVEDRIALGYAGKEEVIGAHRQEIAEEILAEGGVKEGVLEGSEYTNMLDIEGETFTFWLKRV